MSAPAPELEPGVYEKISISDLEDIVGDIDWDVVPETLGPTWELDPDWTGPRDPDGYILPHMTLGWQVIDWIEKNLVADETDDFDEPLPFKLTNEQMRFILWFYATNEFGHFIYREVVLQRLKGWGKDPIAACIAAVEFVGPCRFKGWVEIRWDTDFEEADLAWARSHGLSDGDPYASPHPRAWVQIAAVSLKQTKNTMLLFKGLFSKECMAAHSIDIGKETIYAYGGQKQIEAVTSSPSSLEGNRPTLVIKNETHHWRDNNDGTEMAAAIERNATKAKGGAARTLSITNAYEPSQKSVAQTERESYEAQAAGLAYETGVLYDSLEAPKAARLRPLLEKEVDPRFEHMSSSDKEIIVRRYLTRILEVCRGGAWWLDIPSLVNSILSPNNPPSRSRRFWFNQVVSAEDAWVDGRAVDAAVSRFAKEAREHAERDQRGVLEAGWIVLPEEPIVMFFDGSKSDDSTALVGCRLSDGYVFTIGVWQKPIGKRGEDWLAPRGAVDSRVNEAFLRFNIVAFWGDPSHTKDDEDGTRYWDGMFDTWMRKYSKDDPNGRWDALPGDHWPTKGGHRKHAIMFDMAGPDQQKLFVGAAETFVEEMESLNDIEEFAPEFKIDGHPALVQHLRNAVRNPSQWGVSLMKENRESAKKIDLAVCAVGARMLRRIVLNGPVKEEEERDGTVWGVGF